MFSSADLNTIAVAGNANAALAGKQSIGIAFSVNAVATAGDNDVLFGKKTETKRECAVFHSIKYVIPAGERNAVFNRLGSRALRGQQKITITRYGNAFLGQ